MSYNSQADTPINKWFIYEFRIFMKLNFFVYYNDIESEYLLKYHKATNVLFRDLKSEYMWQSFYENIILLHFF